MHLSKSWINVQIQFLQEMFCSHLMTDVKKAASANVDARHVRPYAAACTALVHAVFWTVGASTHKAQG